VLAKNCRTMASLMLIRLDKNSVYDEKVFEAKQAEHRAESRRRLEGTHQAMRSVLRDIYANFKEGSGEVQREWRALLVTTDKAVEQALRQTVKKSLQELSRAINGDQKVDAQSLFKVRPHADWVPGRGSHRGFH
jgi:dynein heavy chain